MVNGCFCVFEVDPVLRGWFSLCWIEWSCAPPCSKCCVDFWLSIAIFFRARFVVMPSLLLSQKLFRSVVVDHTCSCLLSNGSYIRICGYSFDACSKTVRIGVRKSSFWYCLLYAQLYDMQFISIDTHVNFCYWYILPLHVQSLFIQFKMVWSSKLRSYTCWTTSGPTHPYL